MHSSSDLITAPWSVFVLFAAVRLRLFTAIGDDLLSVAQVAHSCNVQPAMAHALVEACVALGLLERRGELCANTPLSTEHLVEGRERYLGDLIELLNDESDRWLRLAEISLEREASDARPTHRPGDHRTFIMGMENLGRLGEADALCEAVDLAGCRRMIDAGGGSGLYSQRLCAKYPSLHATILDGAESLVVARELLDGCDERTRIELREADLRCDPFGEGIDVVLVSDVVYDRAAAEAILPNARRCLIPGGQLIIRGYYHDASQRRSLFAALFLLNVLAFDPDRVVLSTSDLSDVVERTGFDRIEVRTLTERSILLTARAPHGERD